jgi:hypothetical protein
MSVWFELHTASYVGDIQPTGSVFSRVKFDAVMARTKRLQQAPQRMDLCSDPALDWVVSKRQFAGQMPAAQTAGWNLYACNGRNGT